MKKLLAVAVFAIAMPAYAMIHFLVSQWIAKGDTMCQYDNGTVLNVGARICPMSIND